MLKTILLLDGSSAMNSAVDYLPTRILALRPCVQQFVRTYLDTSPLSLLGTVVMRDTTAHTLTPLTNSASEIFEALEVRYFLHGGSGAMSIEAGFRTAFSELVELRKKSMKAALRVVLVAASVTLVDGGDISALTTFLKRVNIQVDIIHLAGSVHALQQLASVSGSYQCPVNYDHLQQMLATLPLRAASSKRKKSSMKRLRDEGASPAALRDDDLGADSVGLVPIGFPEIVPSTERPGKHYLVCPQCKLPQLSIPSVCPLCSLLVGCLPFIHVSFIWRNNLVPPASDVVVPDTKTRLLVVDGDDHVPSAPQPITRCALCDVELLLLAGDGDAAVQCGSCAYIRCKDCDEFVRCSVGVCPTCVA